MVRTKMSTRPIGLEELTPVLGSGMPDLEVLLLLESPTPSAGVLDMRRAWRMGGELMLRAARYEQRVLRRDSGP